MEGLSGCNARSNFGVVPHMEFCNPRANRQLRSAPRESREARAAGRGTATIGNAGDVDRRRNARL
jgi:hypothetical protein